MNDASRSPSDPVAILRLESLKENAMQSEQHSCRPGQELIEYALLIVLISVLAIIALTYAESHSDDAYHWLIDQF